MFYTQVLKCQAGRIGEGYSCRAIADRGHNIGWVEPFKIDNAHLWPGSCRRRHAARGRGADDHRLLYPRAQRRSPTAMAADALRTRNILWISNISRALVVSADGHRGGAHQSPLYRAHCGMAPGNIAAKSTAANSQGSGRSVTDRLLRWRYRSVGNAPRSSSRPWTLGGRPVAWCNSLAGVLEHCCRWDGGIGACDCSGNARETARRLIEELTAR